MKKMNKIVTLGMAAALSAAMLIGCGSSAKDAGAASSESGKKELVIATNATFPPYESKGENGIEGIDVDIANAIGDKLGYSVKFEDVDFDSIIGGVAAGKFDMGMAGMTVTEDRKKSADFSDPYTNGVQVVIVKEDSEIKDVADITTENKIGVQQGTTGDIYASSDVEDGGFGEDAVVRFKSGPDAVAALKAGKVDCVIIDKQPAKAYVKSNEGLKILETAYTDEDYAICFKKGNTELLNKVNGALKELKEDGTIDSIVKKYITD